MINIITITQALLEKNSIFIDTRTPKEYAEDHLPSAVNIPIFSNEERAIIGTMYKQVSKEKAIEKGVELFSQKLPHFMAQINQYKKKQLLIYCWRGGMRSRTVTALLESLGYQVKQIEGGYKAYRQYVREKLHSYQLKPKLIVLWGLTCTGKSGLLKHFPNSIDLENLAQHRGSLYGAIGLQPRSQKQFENLLLQELERLNQEKYIMVEGESRKIGDVQLPEFFYTAMKNGIPIRVQRPLQQRAEYAVERYFNKKEDIENIKQVTQKLWKVISKNHQQEVLHLLEQKHYIDAAKILLEFYYDPLYEHTLNKIEYAFEIHNEIEKNAAEEIKQKIAILV